MLSQPKQHTPVSDFLPFIPALPSIYLPSFSPSLVSPSTTRLFPTDSPHPHLTLCPSHALTDGCMPVPKLHSLPPSILTATGLKKCLVLALTLLLLATIDRRISCQSEGSQHLLKRLGVCGLAPS
ncbi:hypothetical protein DL95DRAFT_137650 [Leptodontidium sp. 2 PMI_412]|nr:hypothetical protein DL95DRAFT_137650 [Leptodontidium sp. 2 PMI_412]